MCNHISKFIGQIAFFILILMQGAPIKATSISFEHLIEESRFADDEGRPLKSPHKPYHQYDFDALTHEFDKDGVERFYKWLRARDERWKSYIEARKWLEAQKDKLTKKNEQFTRAHVPASPTDDFVPYTDEEEAKDVATERVTHAQQTLNSFQEKLIGPRGYYRTLDAEKLRIMVHTSSFTPRRNFKISKRQHPYKMRPTILTGRNRVIGFILHPTEVPIMCRRLKRLCDAMTHDLTMLTEGLTLYNETFYPKANEWSSWMFLQSTTEAEQDKLERRLVQKMGIPTSWRTKERDETTDEGYVMAMINRDALGNHRRKIFARIIRIYEGILGLGEAAKLDQQYAQLPKYTEPDEPIKTINFESLYKGLDELTEIPHLDKGGKAIAWFYHISTRQYIFDTIIGKRNFVIPLGTRPAEDFRAFPSLDYHRANFITVLKQFHQKRAVTAPNPDSGSWEEKLAIARNTPFNMEEARVWAISPEQSVYIEQYKRLQNLLESHRAISLKLLQPAPSYLGLTSYIPNAWEFITKDLRTKSLSRKIPQGNNIFLGNLGIEDQDLMVPEVVPGALPSITLLGGYEKISLSNNNLTGAVRYGFGRFLTDLNLSFCKLTSLHCLEEVPGLVKLDISHNQLTTFHHLISLEKLKILMASNNNAVDLKPISLLPELEKADVSHNKITTMCSLRNPQLRELIAGHNPLQGMWQEALPHPLAVASLELLDLTAVGEGFKLYGVGGVFKKDAFKERYPAIKTLKTLHENFEWIDEIEVDEES